MTDTILAIVPARAGSKRLPGKNIRPLAGLPLIAWTLQAARSAGCLTRLVVSTDDEELAAIARQHGAEVPWLRSPTHATDEANVLGAVREVLSRLEAAGEKLPGSVLLLQPTSPFRTAATIQEAVARHRESGNSVVSVAPAASHPYWCKAIGPGGTLLPFMDTGEASLRSQDLPPVYALNGAIYLSTVANLEQRGSFYGEPTQALVMADPAESIDIDTPYDWAIAEAFAELRAKAKS